MAIARAERVSEDGLLLYREDFSPIDQFPGQNFLSAKQFNPKNISTVMERADEYGEMMSSRTGRLKLKRRFAEFEAAVLFYEASTRTRSSFEFALDRLGIGRFTDTDIQMSSRVKGESLGHTVRVLTGPYGADMVVIRDPKRSFFDEVLPYTEQTATPVFNAGDGDREHPFQALKDIYAFHKDFGKVDGLTITFLGDLKYSRVVHSLAYLLAQYKVDVNLVAPSALKAPPELVEILSDGQGSIRQYCSLRELEESGDVVGDAVYVTRLQTERMKKDRCGHEGPAIQTHIIRTYAQDFSIDEDFLHRYPEAKIYHPLPIERVRWNDSFQTWEEVPGEVRREVDFSPQNRYFAQSDNGVLIAASLTSLILDV